MGFSDLFVPLYTTLKEDNYHITVTCRYQARKVSDLCNCVLDASVLPLSMIFLLDIESEYTGNLLCIQHTGNILCIQHT